ncbi:hypothetical protein [Aeromonas phage 65.2]|nr:hypothetical protein [Aeromonas phage 65.2]
MLMKVRNFTYYDPRTMQYIVDDQEGTSDRVCMFSNPIISDRVCSMVSNDIISKKEVYKEEKIVKNKNAEYISKFSSSLNGLSKSIIASGIEETPYTWWTHNPTRGGFKANPDIPPVVAVKNMEDLKFLSREISKTKNAKITFIGLINLSYLDLSYNDGEVKIQSIDIVNPPNVFYNYIGYVFSYGSTSNTFCLRLVDGGKGRFDKNVVDIMNGYDNNGISKDLQDFIKECRYELGVYNEK